MKTADAELRAIIRRGDAAAATLIKAIVKDLEPDDDRRVTIKDSSRDKVGKLRDLYDGLGKRIAKVSGGGKAKDQLLVGVKQVEEGLAQFSLAAQISYSTEQIEAFEAARHSLRAGMRKISRSSKRLAQ